MLKQFLAVAAAIVVAPAVMAQERCPAGEQSGSSKVDILKMERSNGALTITVRVQSNFNLPMKISPYQWGHDRHQVRDSLGQDWPYMHGWKYGASRPNTALEPGQFYRTQLRFQLSEGETTVKYYDVSLNFMTIPARPGIKLGESRMFVVKWSKVPAACVTPMEE